MNFTYVLLYLVYILNDYINQPTKIKQITLFFNIMAPRTWQPFILSQTMVYMTPITRQPFIPSQRMVCMSPRTWQPLLSFQTSLPTRQTTLQLFIPGKQPSNSPYLMVGMGTEEMRELATPRAPGPTVKLTSCPERSTSRIIVE